MIPYRSSLFLLTCLTFLGCISPAKSSTEKPQIKLLLAQSISSPSPASIPGQTIPVTPSPTQAPMLGVGNQGPEVVDLQTKLKQLGYFQGNVDGIYGASTEIAVAKFQKSVGLTADGVIGPTTWNRLQSQVKPAQKPSETKVRQSTEAKSGSSKNLLWLILGFGVATVTVGGAIFFLIKSFNKAVAPIERDPEANPEKQFLDRNSFHSQGLIASDSHAQISDKDRNHNGYAVLEPHNDGKRQPADSGRSLSEDSLWDSSSEEANDLMPLEKTTRLSKLDIVEELIADLRSHDRKKRRKAVWDLAQQGDSRAVQPLVDLMIDSDSQQRTLILEALSQIAQRTLKPINRALAISLQDQNSQVRKNAIRDVTRIYNMMGQVLQMLRYAADDPDADVQQTARWAIEQLTKLRTHSGIDSLPTLPNSDNNSESRPD